MGNPYLRLISCAIVFSMTMLGLSSVHAHQYVKPLVDTASKPKSTAKISDTRSDKPAFLKYGIKVNVIPFKPIQVKTISTSTSSTSNLKKDDDSDKILNNVKVFPNPVADQLNLTYNINKDSNVIIKIMDLLGNEVITLLNQRISAGEQANSFSLSSRLNSGFYFIRFIVGTETVIKRISVL
ncbi:MAG: hypothetical protein JWQ25_1972 [Daejeonella sp.]|nr:hypothetical protein [Daejeonella sp.]